MDKKTKNILGLCRPGFEALLFASFLLITSSGQSQLSPGELHQSHAHLEGLKNCSQCHGVGQRISAENCFKCHTILKKQVESRRGLHANPGYTECEKCHVEHHGRNFELIYWEEGQENFDHRKTGFILEGKHRELDCRDCHRAKHIAEEERLRQAGKYLNRTFLGLDNQCLSCHYDEHRGQLSQNCGNCHAMQQWKPVRYFSHNSTNYPLEGKHRSVTCDKCHSVLTDIQINEDKEYLKFINVKHNRCTDCHTDIHGNRFGPDCQSCHSPAGWQDYNTARFDHSRTAFPLEGKHRLLDCETCHIPGQPLKIRQFSRCLDCHTDYHRGQFSDRQSGGDCGDCHSEKGFLPVDFTIDEHQNTEFPLKGGHLAVPCNACHKKKKSGTPDEMIQFTFQSTRCRACHQDPHRQSSKEYTGESGCETCHSIDSWRLVNFDHNQTGFLLEYRHTEISCRSCHEPDKNVPLIFKDLKKECSSCHKDPHQAQFALKSGQTDQMTPCQNCHTPRNWKAEKFDHNHQASFKLEGAHAKLECQKCHSEITRDNITFVKYKPIPHDCVDCHGKPLQKKES